VVIQELGEKKLVSFGNFETFSDFHERKEHGENCFVLTELDCKIETNNNSKLRNTTLARGHRMQPPECTKIDWYSAREILRTWTHPFILEKTSEGFFLVSLARGINAYS